MLFAYLTMITALAISGVAIYYSVAGLAAIFSASVIPIVIMGSILEVAKLVTAVWLHKYWSRAVWWLKTYLSVAVVILMLITSMGIFGFLSKAHIEQTYLSTEKMAQVETINENILKAETKVDRWNEELERLYSGSDVRVDALLGREQSELDNIYKRIEAEKTQIREDAQRKIDIQNNRLSQAQERKRQDIEVAKNSYQDEELNSAISRATANELSVASAVQREIISINNTLSEQLLNVDERFQSQIDDIENRISDLRKQSTNQTDSIDQRVSELEDLIAGEQTIIARMRDEKSQAEQQYRKIEAEVGPVKYIAEFVYGPDADKNLLEEAVRWVIVTIIFVFDPLAVLLLIASQYTFGFHTRHPLPPSESEIDYAKNNDSNAVNEKYGKTEDSVEEEVKYTLDDLLDNKDDLADDDADDILIEEEVETVEELTVEDENSIDIEAVASDYLELENDFEDDIDTETTVTSLSAQEKRKRAYALADKTKTWADAKAEWKANNPTETLKEYKRKFIRGQIDNLPWERYIQNGEQGNNTIWQQIKNAQDNSDNTTG